MQSSFSSSKNRLCPIWQARQTGFTLVEIMIAVLIVGVLLAVAYPSYQDSIRKSRRAEAVNTVNQLMQAQERFRANNPIYGNLNVPADSTTLPSDLPRSTKHYNLSIGLTAGSEGSSYTIIATAKDGQLKDTKCKLMGVRANRGVLFYGSGAGDSIDWTLSDPDTGRCWAK